MRNHKILTLIVFFTLILSNYTLNAKSLNIALFLPFNSLAYSKMAKTIHDGINDSINNSELDVKIEKFYESDSLMTI